MAMSRQRELERLSLPGQVKSSDAATGRSSRVVKYEGADFTSPFYDAVRWNSLILPSYAVIGSLLRTCPMSHPCTPAVDCA